MRLMPPQNTIHSARTLHDLLNLFFVRASRPSQLFSVHTSRLFQPSFVHRLDLLDLHLFMRHDILNLSRQSLTKFYTFSQQILSLSFQISRHSVTMFLCQFSRPSFTTPNFLGHPSRCSCANFLGHAHDVLVPSFLGNPSRSSSANFLGHPSRSCACPSRCSCANFLGNPVTTLLCPAFGLTLLDCQRRNLLLHQLVLAIDQVNGQLFLACLQQLDFQFGQHVPEARVDSLSLYKPSATLCFVPTFRNHTSWFVIASCKIPVFHTDVFHLSTSRALCICFGC